MNNQNNQSLEDSINRQLKVNRSKNLLNVNAEQIMDIDPSFLAALEKLLDASAGETPMEVSPEIVDYAAQALIKRIHTVNQYIRVSNRQMEELKEIYKQTWQAMQQSRNVHLALREIHYPALSQWLAPLYPKAFRKQLRSQSEVGHVVNEEYTAEFQVALFEWDVSQIKQPVLDIGCGSRANLVRYLRSLGVEAFGFDRYLEINEPYLEQSDWFDYPFRKDSWGTIVSNMAFTNHLNYAHLHDISQLEPYLLKMIDILKAMVLGGKFYYAPSLPFLEDWLDAQRYIVDSQPVAGELYFSTIIKSG